MAGISEIDTFNVAVGRCGKLMLPSKLITRTLFMALLLVISNSPFSHGTTAVFVAPAAKTGATAKLPVNFNRPSTNSPALPVVKPSASTLPFNSPFAVAMEAAMLITVSATCAVLLLSAASTTRLLP